MWLDKIAGTQHAFAKIICAYFNLEHILKNKIRTEIQARYGDGDGTTTLSYVNIELL